MFNVFSVLSTPSVTYSTLSCVLLGMTEAHSHHHRHSQFLFLMLRCRPSPAFLNMISCPCRALVFIRPVLLIRCFRQLPFWKYAAEAWMRMILNTCIVIAVNNERKILHRFLAFFINCKFHTPTNNIRQYQLCEPLSTYYIATRDTWVMSWDTDSRTTRKAER